MWYHKLKPVVHRHVLLALAGLMWTGVGIMLIVRAVIWLSIRPYATALLIAVVSTLFAVAAYYFGFTKTVEKNIKRLCSLPEKVCIFAFNSPKGYFMIFLMIGLGIALRRSPLPREPLAFIYIIMGGSLFLASFHFYRRLWHVAYHGRPCFVPEEE